MPKHESVILTVKLLCALIAVEICCASLPAAVEPVRNSPGSSQLIFTKAGWSADARFFPIAVWLQDPRNAVRYQAAGINLYVGLWQGPTTAQLDQLQSAHMPVICEQNQIGLENKDNPTIAGWMHGDEPDNAQSLGDGKGYGPPIPPENILKDYQRIHSADPSRPVMLNLGQGVAWDDWIGRGVRRNHPEDYAEYVKGCNIASFDIYPVVHDSPEISGKLEMVAKGAERLAGWTRGQKPVWSCIECTHIGNPRARATPPQVRAEVWMALTRGARGLIYFVHQFKPAFREAALLEDTEMLDAVAGINRQIRELAPLLNSSTVSNRLAVQSSNPGVALASMLKQNNQAAYVFTVNLTSQPTRATFTLREIDLGKEAEVLGESRGVPVQAESFTDEFAPYAVHLYRLAR